MSYNDVVDLKQYEALKVGHYDAEAPKKRKKQAKRGRAIFTTCAWHLVHRMRFLRRIIHAAAQNGHQDINDILEAVKPALTLEARRWDLLEQANGETEGITGLYEIHRVLNRDSLAEIVRLPPFSEDTWKEWREAAKVLIREIFPKPEEVPELNKALGVSGKDDSSRGGDIVTRIGLGIESLSRGIKSDSPKP